MDSDIKEIIKSELKRQQETLELIASENFVSPAVLSALGSAFTNKYAEGYPGARYYAGNEFADQMESLAQKRGLELFGLEKELWGINVQPYSGSPANLAVYVGLLELGDKILALPLSHGAHLTHGHKVSFTGKAYQIINYHVNKETHRIDYDELEQLALEHHPKIIVLGGTAIPRDIDYARVTAAAKKVGAYSLIDASHFIGLVAGKALPSPFDFEVDVVTFTTHKTLRGPRAAVIISRKELSTKIDKAIFPGLQGGPHLNQIAAIAQAFTEAKTDEFKDYSKKVIANAKALGEALVARGYKLVSGGTDTHLLLVDLTPKGIAGKQAQEILEKAGIIANMNTVPYDPRKPNDPSGIRFGSAALTTRGMAAAEMEEIAQIIDDVLTNRLPPETARAEVKSLCEKFPIPGYGTFV